jgi:hypothetical protein
MSIRAEDWSVVIVGYWNRAIYTPAGIARRLFKLDPSVPVEVLIALDSPLPYKVKHANQTVTVGSDKMVINPDNQTYEALVGAMEIGRRALDDLPLTPFSAVGFNLKYRSDGPVDELIQLTAHAADDRLSDEGMEIQERAIVRSVGWKNGKLRISVAQQQDQSFQVLLNFDLQSDDVKKIRAWIEVTPEVVKREAEKILHNYFGLRKEELAHV